MDSMYASFVCWMMSSSRFNRSDNSLVGLLPHEESEGSFLTGLLSARENIFFSYIGGI